MLMTPPVHRLLARQMDKARAPDGTIDIDRLTELVNDAYEEAERYRRRTDRAVALMAEELEQLNGSLARAMDDLSETNQRLSLALDNMSQGLCLYDDQDRVLVANHRFAPILGLPEGAIRPGMTFQEVIEAELAVNLFEKRPVEEILHERRALIDGAAQETRVLEFNGHGRHIAATYRRIPTGGWIKTVTDITAERQAEAQAAPNARLAALGEMAAGLAHELRQPLTTVVLAATNAGRALERGATDSVRERLERCIAQAMRASDLIDHLRRFARGWDTVEEATAVSLDEPLEGALVLVRGTLREAGIEILTDLGSPAPMVLGRSLAIEQILVNLMMNARDALAALSPDRPRRVSLTAMAVPGGVELRVADTGGGIPEELMPRLFQPFVTTKGPDRGTGLGLSICNGLMRTMGGAISVTNEADGACFRLRFRPPPP